MELICNDRRERDRMNVKSALKLFDQRLMNLLKSHEESGTVFYLKIMKYVYEAFHQIDLSTHEIFFKIWWAVMALNIWRNIQGTQGFISSNAYVCVQINAHSLLTIYRHPRDSNQLNLFVSTLYSSQTCESFFRFARSFTTQSTVINFSIHQFLHRLKRIQVAEDLQSQFTKGNIYDFLL